MIKEPKFMKFMCRVDVMLYAAIVAAKNFVFVDRVGCPFVTMLLPKETLFMALSGHAGTTTKRV